MAYSVYSYPSYYTATGMLVIYAGTSMQNASAVLSMIDREIDRLVKEGITRDEFEKTRTQIRGSYVLGLESASARMNAMGRRMLILGSTQTEDDVLRRLSAIQFDEVNDVLRRLLTGPCAAALASTSPKYTNSSPGYATIIIRSTCAPNASQRGRETGVWPFSYTVALQIPGPAAPATTSILRASPVG